MWPCFWVMYKFFLCFHSLSSVPFRFVWHFISVSDFITIKIKSYKIRISLFILTSFPGDNSFIFCFLSIFCSIAFLYNYLCQPPCLIYECLPLNLPWSHVLENQWCLIHYFLQHQDVVVTRSSWRKKGKKLFLNSTLIGRARQSYNKEQFFGMSTFLFTSSSCLVVCNS